MQSADQAVQYIAYGPQAAAFGAQTTVANAQMHTRGFNLSQQKAMKMLAGIQIAIGILSVIVEVVLLSANRSYSYFYFDQWAAGIWCGAFYITAGCLGLAAVWKNTSALTVWTMIISIMSSVLVWFVVGNAAAAIDRSVYLENYKPEYPCQSKDYISYSRCTYRNYAGYKAADSIFLVMSLAEFVVSVWTAVLCSKASCRPCCRRSCTRCCDGWDCTFQTPAMYVGTTQAGYTPQFIVLPQSNIPGGQAIGLTSAPQGHSVGLQHLMFAPAASAYGRPGISRTPNYSTAQVEASTVCPSGELTIERMAS